MSKRFGRNQKRALMAQLTSAKSVAAIFLNKLEDEKDVSAKMGERITELEDVIDFTREVLGEFFVTLPVKTKPLEVGVDVLRLPISQPDARLSFSRVNDCAELASMALRFEELEAISHDIKEQFDDVRGMMMVRFRNGAGCWSYGYNRNSFRGMRREKVAAIIAGSLREYMLQNPGFFDQLGVK